MAFCFPNLIISHELSRRRKISNSTAGVLVQIYIICENQTYALDADVTQFFKNYIRCLNYSLKYFKSKMYEVTI